MDTTTNPNKAMSAAIRTVGGTARLSERLGVSISSVMQWEKGARPVPLMRAVQIEDATNGEVRREELAPHIDWTTLESVLRRRRPRSLPA